MDAESYGAAIRQARDGALSPQDSWRFRHGHTILGVAVEVWYLHPIEELAVKDLMVFFLAAAKTTEATDLKLRFTKESALIPEEIFQKIDGLWEELEHSDFTPVAGSAKISDKGIGWLRFSLFTKDDLPIIPFTMPVSMQQEI